MDNRPHFTDADIERQRVFESECWNVILPKMPISPYHLILVVKDADKKTFGQIGDDELSDLRDCVRLLVSSAGNSCDGYNLFSNNGTVRVGQHIGQFHQHIFLRFTDEAESPYAVMWRGERWAEDSEDSWTRQRDLLRQTIMREIRTAEDAESTQDRIERLRSTRTHLKELYGVTVTVHRSRRLGISRMLQKYNCVKIPLRTRIDQEAYQMQHTRRVHSSNHRQGRVFQLS